MVLRPSIGSFVIEPHAVTHENGGNDEIFLKNLEGYDEVKAQTSFLDSLGYSVARQVQREIDLGSHPDPDGSVRFVVENKSIYKRLKGSWIKVAVATSDVYDEIVGKMSYELIPTNPDDWEVGSLSDETGLPDEARQQSLRMVTEAPIKKGETYTLSDVSEEDSKILEIWLVEYTSGNLETVTKITRGGSKTFVATGDTFKLTFRNSTGGKIEASFFNEPDSLIKTQLVQGRQRAEHSLHPNNLVTKQYLEETTPRPPTVYGGGNNLLPGDSGLVVDAISGRNFEVLHNRGLEAGSYVISFKYNIIEEVNKIDYFLLYQGERLTQISLETVNGRASARFDVTEEYAPPKGYRLYLYAGNGAIPANPNHVVFEEVMLEYGDIASSDYRPGE